MTKVSIIAGAAASFGFVLHAGRRNSSILLLVIMAFWVVTPFLLISVGHIKAMSWPSHMRHRLSVITVVVTVAILIVYTFDAWRPLTNKGAFVFVVIPPLACLLVGAALVTLRPSRTTRRIRTSG